MGKKNTKSSFWEIIGGILLLIIDVIFIGGLLGGCGYVCYEVYRWVYPPDYVAKIESAIDEKDFQKASKLLRDMKKDHIYMYAYEENYNKVFQAEISYLVNEGDQQSSDRLIALVNEYPFVSKPAIGTTHDSDIIEGNDKYNAEVGKFNYYCDQILSRAISTKNQYLAEAIVNNFKPTLERKKVDTHFWGNDEYDYQYVETDKENAKKILKEAIKEGKFNNQD